MSLTFKNIYPILSKSFTVLQYFALILATVCVIIFQFLSVPVVMYICLSLYSVGFAICAARSIISTCDIFSASRRAKGADGELIASKNYEVIAEKPEKIKSIIVSCLWLLVFGFSLYLSIHYPIIYPM